MVESLTYIEKEELAEKLQGNDDSFVVIDVRGDDYFEGHIPNAVQVQSETFDDPAVLDDILTTYAEKKTIVVHCMQSLKRGPNSALKLSERLNAVGPAAEGKPEIVVLRGGFAGWQEAYSKDDGLIEGSGNGK